MGAVKYGGKRGEVEAKSSGVVCGGCSLPIYITNMLKSLKAHSKLVNSDLALMGHPQCLPVSTQRVYF